MRKTKPFIRAPREVLVAETARENKLIAQNADFFTEDKKTIRRHAVRRRHEYNGAGNMYIADAIKYICTHEPECLRDSITRYTVQLNWDAFVKRAIGDRNDQYHRLCNEIWRTIEKSEACYLPKDGGGWYLMQPYVIDLSSEDGARLSEAEKKRLGQLNVKKLGAITIHFAKPLFQRFVEGGQFFQYPANLYARVHQYISEGVDFLNTRKPEPEENTSAVLHSEDFEFNVISAIDYLYLHGAGDSRKKTLIVNIKDFTRSCLPSMGYEKSGVFYTRNEKKENYLFLIMNTVRQLKELDFTITGIEENGSDSITFLLDHPDRVGKKIPRKKGTVKG